MEPKARLLKYGAAEFAVKGFDGASTRNIVGKAKMNISAISYHFGGKKGLYEAILTEIVNNVDEVMQPLLERYEQVLQKNDSKIAQDLLCDFMKAFLRIISENLIDGNKCMIYLHEYANPSPSFKVVDESLNAKYFKIYINLLLIINKGKMSEREAMLLTFMLFSQIFVIFTRQKNILKLMEWKDYGEKELDFILSILSKSVVSDKK